MLSTSINSGVLASLRSKAAQVVAYHFDDGCEGRPLFLLFSGGVLAVVGLTWIATISWFYWHEHLLDPTLVVPLLAFVGLLYVAGIFLFSLAYELYDLASALRLTALLSLCGIGAILCVFVIVQAGVVVLRLGGRAAVNAASGRWRDCDPADEDESSGILSTPYRTWLESNDADNIYAIPKSAEKREGVCSACDRPLIELGVVPKGTPLVAGLDYCPECHRIYDDVFKRGASQN